MKHKITITITVGKAISPEDEVQSIHFNVTTPAKENDMDFKNCENNDLRKYISKLLKLNYLQSKAM